MLLTRCRTSLIYLCLAGMEAAWFTPVWLLMYQPVMPLWLAYAGVLATLLAWTLALELLSRTGIESPAYDAVALGLMAATSALLVVPSLVVTRLPLGRAFGAVFDFTQGFPPTLAFVAANLFLWQRATSATSRDIGFFSVGVSFRAGLLLLIATATAISALIERDLTPLLWPFLAAGLIAVAVARIHDKATGVQSAGKPLPPRRFGQLLTAVVATVSGIALLASVYTPAGIRALLAWFSPLWRGLEYLLFGVLWLLGLILNPLLEWLAQEIARVFRDFQLDLSPLTAPLFAERNEPGVLSRLLPWVKIALTNAGVALAIVVVTLIVIVILVLYLDKARRETGSNGEEAEDVEKLSFGGGIFGRGLAALRRAVRLVRRYGVGRGLLTAVSVQNIYANLCRLARRRGYGRRPAQPPDVYLPTLAQAFPGHNEALARITAAYMRVHYGEHPVTFAELAGVRADYQAIRQGGEGTTGGTG